MFEIVLFALVILCLLVILACKYLFTGVRNRTSIPWYLDYARSFFPVLLIVFLLRGFVAEPFRIPSGSMLPTLEVGDFILVNKFTYGIRLPVIFNKIIPVNNPERGDVMVFRFPGDNKTNYIKRVVGVPGDHIETRNKQLYVNGSLVQKTYDGTYAPFPINGRQLLLNQFDEKLFDKQHKIVLNSNSVSPTVDKMVPEGHYFMMGDNRDHSLDSRYWGFVPEENIVGKAFFVWFHLNNLPGGGIKLSRFGSEL